MNISRKSRFGQAITSGLAIVTVHGTLSLAGLGVPDQVAAQATSVPPRPITFGQNVAGTLAATDPVTGDGRPRDRYRLVTRAPNQRYVITVRSPAVPLRSDLAFVAVNLAGDPAIAQQEARTLFRNQQIQYSGTLASAGQYLISVRSNDVQRPVGAYTIRLTGGPAAPPAGQ